jgi:hypothetical protein
MNLQVINFFLNFDKINIKQGIFIFFKKKKIKKEKKKYKLEYF